MSRLDTNGFAKSNQIAQKIKQQLEAGEFVGATDSWAQLESVISQNSNAVVIALIVSHIFSFFFLGSSKCWIILFLHVELIVQDFYNFLLDSGMDPVSLTASTLAVGASMRKYSRYLSAHKSSTPDGDGDVGSLMNGVIKKKLKIIPENITCVLLNFSQKIIYNSLNDL